MTDLAASYTLPTDQGDWTPLHWFVYFIKESGDLDISDALTIAAVLLKNPQVVVAALEETGVFEAIQETPVIREDLTDAEDSAKITVE